METKRTLRHWNGRRKRPSQCSRRCRTKRVATRWPGSFDLRNIKTRSDGATATFWPTSRLSGNENDARASRPAQLVDTRSNKEWSRSAHRLVPSCRFSPRLIRRVRLTLAILFTWNFFTRGLPDFCTLTFEPKRRPKINANTCHYD